jgi:cobaltochelatase CobN
MKYLAAQAGLSEASYGPPEAVRTTGLYHPDSEMPFTDAASYLSWRGRTGKSLQTPGVGLLFHYSQLAEGNTADVDALVASLEGHGLLPWPIFSEWMDEKRDKGAYPWFELTGTPAEWKQCST